MSDEAIWSAQDTTPAAIEAALRQLLVEQHAKNESYAPARVLNMIAVVDREWRGEIYNRLEGVGRYHASRTILAAVENGRETIDAVVTLSADVDPAPGELVPTVERVVLDIGPQHVQALGSIVDPLVVPDLATVCWAPHGHSEGIDSVLHLSQVVLIDSVNEPDPAGAIKRARELTAEAYVVDLAWLRSTPWRERVAASFDPRAWREELGRLSAATVRHRPDSAAAGALFFGWLASRLGWEPGALMQRNGSLYGRAHGRRGDVELLLEPDPEQSAPGLAGIVLETASGMKLALDRGPGGLTAKRQTRDGKETSWTVLGASRGEAGILGEGIRQALLRDPTYGPALDCAEAMFA